MPSPASAPPKEAAARLIEAGPSHAWPEVERALAAFLRGKPEVIRLTLTALLAGGHVLLEDRPGVGKTTLVRALAAVLGFDLQRIQCTSDLMPADLLGVEVYDAPSGSFRFRPGPVFAQLLLVDELNRASPKTQSALLEAMAEGQVSVDRKRHPLPTPFAVIATQNPLDMYGTYPLPESQLDRFLLRLSVGYPAREAERQVLAEVQQRQSIRTLPALVELEAFEDAKQQCRQVYVDDSVMDYLHAIVLKTRAHPDFAMGASTRAAIAWLDALRAYAWLEGRRFVIPEDVRMLAVPVLAHRVVLRGAEVQDREMQEQALRELIRDVPAPV